MATTYNSEHFDDNDETVFEKHGVKIIILIIILVVFVGTLLIYVYIYMPNKMAENSTLPFKYSISDKVCILGKHDGIIVKRFGKENENLYLVSYSTSVGVKTELFHEIILISNFCEKNN